MASGRNTGTANLRRDGGYSKGLRPVAGNTSNPHLTDIDGPKDPIAQDPANISQKGMGVESYKSPENQKGKPFSGIQDTETSQVPQLMRSTPGVGMYHSEGQNRGGGPTANYDTTTDQDLQVHRSWQIELAAKQDAASKDRKDTD